MFLLETLRFRGVTAAYQLIVIVNRLGNQLTINELIDNLHPYPEASAYVHLVTNGCMQKLTPYSAEPML